MKYFKDYATCWNHMGVELGINAENIQKDHGQDSVVCFMETCQKWLDSTPHATWRMLEDAFNKVLKPGD